MEIHDQVKLLGKAQEQLALLVESGAPEGLGLVATILAVAERKFSGFADVRHNPSLLCKLQGESRAV